VGSSTAAIRGSLFTVDLMPYDIERIEVLKGPQGTLYGAASMGGLLKYVLKSPDPSKLDIRAGLNASTIDHAHALGAGAKAAINVPIVEDKLAIRVSAFHQYTPGYIDDVGLGKEDQNDTKQQGGRAALFWQPAEDFTIKASAMVQTIESRGSNGIRYDRATLEPFAGPWETFTEYPASFNQNAKLFAVVAEWDSPVGTLTSASNWQRLDSTVISDATSAVRGVVNARTNNAYPDPRGRLIQVFNLRKFNQELRLASPSGKPLEWLVGVYYTSENSPNYQDYTAFTSLTGGPVPGDVNKVLVVDIPWTYKEYAAFANATYRFSDMFSLTAGIRYAENHQDISSQIYGTLFGGTNAPVPPTVIDFQEGIVTWLVSPQIKLGPDSMIYGRVATGFRPGGYTFAFVPGAPLVLNSDSVTNYEVGYKGQFADGKIAVDISAYNIDWKDIQVTLVVPGIGGYFGNGKTARIKGGEAALTVQPMRGLNVRGGLAFTDARLTADAPGIGGLDGDRIPLSSRWNGSISVDYSTALSDTFSLEVGGGYRFASNSLGTVESNANASTYSRGDPVDFYAGLTTDNVSMRLFARNLFNAQDRYTFIRNQATTAPIAIGPIQPRTIGFSIDVNY
jgi:outer membrane receptor protein involved in Fe transport